MNDQITIAELMASQTKKHQSKILFQRRDGWSWKQITWLDFDRDVKGIASFLMDTGFGPGDAVLLACPSLIDSIFAEFAVYLLGGVTIHIGKDESVENLGQMSRDYRIKLAFASDEDAANRILDLSAEMPDLKKIVVLLGSKADREEMTILFSHALRFGLLKRKQLEDDLSTVSRSILPNSPAAVRYVLNSGEKTKKMEITQAGLIGALRLAADRLSFIGGEDQSFSYLASSGLFERFINHLALYMGTRIVIADKSEDFFADILEVKPTLLFATRTGLESICSKILSDSETKSSREKLKMSLGNRLKYVLTDYMPESEIISLLSQSGASVIEVSELNKLVEAKL